MIKPTYKVAYLLMLLLLNSCIWGTVDDDINPPFEVLQQHEAVTISRTEFENSTELLPAEPILETGKIYVKDVYLSINQIKGFIYSTTQILQILLIWLI